MVTCDRELKDVPEWVHLFPTGRNTARDGRVFEVAAPERLVSLFYEQRVDLPIDYHHQNDTPQAPGPAPAAGWINDLESRSDGIWGRVSWTSRARELIANREYRYLSPAFICAKGTAQVLKIKGAGLVHSPALYLTALANQEDTMGKEESFLAQIAELLGLEAEGLDTETAFRALKERLTADKSPDPAKYVPIEALEDLMKKQTSAMNEAKSTRVSEKVETACISGFITPAMRDWATELCMSDEAKFDDFLSRATPAYAHLTKTFAQGKPPSTGGYFTGNSGDVEMVSNLLGIDASKLT